jgi:hypothetical protein
MGFQPNPVSNVDSSAIRERLEHAWPTAVAVEVIRMASGRDPPSSLGKWIREKDDSAETIIDGLAEQCKHDCETLGGDQRSYEFKAYCEKKKKTRNGETREEEIRVLGRIRIGDPEIGDKGGSASMMREATNFIRGIAESQGRIAEANTQLLENVGHGADIMRGMMGTISEAADMAGNMNQHAVKLAEIRLTDERERRAEQRELDKERAEAQAERERDAQIMRVVTSVGSEAKNVLMELLPAIKYKIVVDAAVKAKTHGITVEEPSTQTSTPPSPPSSDDEPDVTVTQRCKMGLELEEIFAMLTDEQRGKIKSASGENVWSLFVAAMSAESDAECTAILRQLPVHVKQLGARKNHLLALLGSLGLEASTRLQMLLGQAGIRSEDWK